MSARKRGWTLLLASYLQFWGLHEPMISIRIYRGCKVLSMVRGCERCKGSKLEFLWLLEATN
jgi:hypothetical protein